MLQGLHAFGSLKNQDQAIGFGLVAVAPGQQPFAPVRGLFSGLFIVANLAISSVVALTLSAPRAHWVLGIHFALTVWAI